MTWQDDLKKPGGINTVVDLIARVRDMLSEMEMITKESFGTAAPQYNTSMDVKDTKDLLDDYEKFSGAVVVEFKKLIDLGELQ